MGLQMDSRTRMIMGQNYRVYNSTYRDGTPFVTFSGRVKPGSWKFFTWTRLGADGSKFLHMKAMNWSRASPYNMNGVIILSLKLAARLAVIILMKVHASIDGMCAYH